MNDPEFDSLDVSHRLAGWQKRLVHMVDMELMVPFDWGTANCADLMSCGVIACLGTDHPALELLGGYSTQEEVMQRLNDGGGLANILSEFFVEVPTFHAFNGDIAILQNAEGTAQAGAIVMDGVIVGKREGVTDLRRIAYRLPIAAAAKIYRV